MTIDIVLLGYPSRIRFAEWQAANSLADEKLPKLSEEQKARARALRVPERHYAVALKAAELSGQRAAARMEWVARLIAEAAKRRDPEARVTSVVWNFREHKHEFFTRHDGRQYTHSIPTQIIDDLLLEKEGAGERLKQAVDFELGGWAD